MRWLLALSFFWIATPATAQEIHTLQRGSYHQILAAHAGKPLIVAMWSVSCTHCGADLDIFSRLANKYPDFRLVMISTDTPDQQPEIMAVLEKYKLAGLAGRVEQWVYSDSFGERLRYEIDPRWYGELPRTYFISSDGSSTGISGVLDEARTETWVRSK